MDTERIRMIVEKVKMNRVRYSLQNDVDMEKHIKLIGESTGLPPEEYGTDSLQEQSDDRNDDETESDDEVELEGTVPEESEKNDPDNSDLVSALLSKAPDMNLNGQQASVLMTLLYLLRMDPAKFESQKEIAINLRLGYSTVERHIRFLRDNNFIETKIVTDVYGSRMVYNFNGLKQTLKDPGTEV